MSDARSLLLDDIIYSGWANQRLLDASSALSSTELERDLHLSHSSIIVTLRHVYDGERVWLDAIRDTPDGETYVLPQGPAPLLSLDSLKQYWPKLWEGYRAWIEKPAAIDDLNTEIIVVMPGCAPGIPRRNVLRHVLDHSQFHRGQMIAMIRALGHCPPAVNRMDYFLGKGI